MIYSVSAKANNCVTVLLLKVVSPIHAKSLFIVTIVFSNSLLLRLLRLLIRERFLLFRHFEQEVIYSVEIIYESRNRF